MQDLITGNEELIGYFNAVFANNTLQKPLIFAYDEVDSTNTTARLYIENGGSLHCGSALFFARTQRAGRGTRMRTFESPRDGGLYMSLLIRPSEDKILASRITMLVAVSVCRVINRLMKDTATSKIKWVNDITVLDKKLSGILTEASLDEYGKPKYIIIGIGVNLTPAEHSSEVEKIMTSLKEYGISISAEELSALITRELLQLLQDKNYSFIDEYRNLSSVIGRRINVIDSCGEYPAIALAINDDGSLIVKKDNGEEKSLISADVSIRPFL